MALLNFNERGKFKVIQFTDLHYTDNERVDRMNDEFQRDLIEWERPDYVVYSGDMVSGYIYRWNLVSNWHWYEDLHFRYTSPVREANIPYSIILGNHDREANLDPMAILKLDSSMDNSLTLKGMYQRNLDYIIPVYYYNKENTTEGVAMFMIFLDTGREVCEGMASWGCVPKPQVEWLNETLATISKEHPSSTFLVYIHIPIEEYMHVFQPNNYNNGEVKGNFREDKISCPIVNTGLFQVLRRFEGHSTSIHCGHDHWNDFEGSIDNIKLYYGRKSGYGPYALPRGMLPGARVMEFMINEDDSRIGWTSWIRNSEGMIEFSERLVLGNPYSTAPRQTQCFPINPVKTWASDNVPLLFCLIGIFIAPLLVFVFKVNKLGGSNNKKH